MTPHVLADDDLARINGCFDPCCRIDAITVEVAVCAYGDIADVNTYAQIVCATSVGRLFAILLAQCSCGADGHFSAWKFGENRITEEFDDSTFVALDGAARQRLQNFNELQRATFVFCGAFAIARDISKPQRNEMMG